MAHAYEKLNYYHIKYNSFLTCTFLQLSQKDICRLGKENLFSCNVYVIKGCYFYATISSTGEVLPVGELNDLTMPDVLPDYSSDLLNFEYRLQEIVNVHVNLVTIDVVFKTTIAENVLLLLKILLIHIYLRFVFGTGFFPVLQHLILHTEHRTISSTSSFESIR